MTRRRLTEELAPEEGERIAREVLGFMRAPDQLASMHALSFGDGWSTLALAHVADTTPRRARVVLHELARRGELVRTGGRGPRGLRWRLARQVPS